MSEAGVPAAADQKVCRRCGAAKRRADYYGKQAVCKTCVCAQKREEAKAWTPEQRKRRREVSRRYVRRQMEKDPDGFRKKANDRAKRHQESRRRLIRDYKKERPCVDCGQIFHPAAMDFHHRNPSEKEFTVSQMLGKPLKVIEAEIAKCDVICSNCHRVRHAEEAA